MCSEMIPSCKLFLAAYRAHKTKRFSVYKLHVGHIGIKTIKYFGVIRYSWMFICSSDIRFSFIDWNIRILIGNVRIWWAILTFYWILTKRVWPDLIGDARIWLGKRIPQFPNTLGRRTVQAASGSHFTRGFHCLTRSAGHVRARSRGSSWEHAGSARREATKYGTLIGHSNFWSEF